MEVKARIYQFGVWVCDALIVFNLIGVGFGLGYGFAHGVLPWFLVVPAALIVVWSWLVRRYLGGWLELHDFFGRALDWFGV